MKKIVMLLAILLTVNVAMAQKSERTSAFMYNKNGQLDKAKESIDKAAVHEKTINDPTTWFYRGIIYLNIVSSEEFSAIDPDALQKSYESFEKALQLDPEDSKEHQAEIAPRIQVIGTLYFQEGVENFNGGDFGNAALKFKKSYDVVKITNKVDTLSLLNAALASVRGNNYEQALNFYNELRSINFDEPDLYKNMAAAYRGLDDKDNMMLILREGRSKYPGDAGLMLEEINAFLSMGRGAEVVDELKALVEKDPNNHSIFFVLGTIYGDETKPELYSVDEAVNYYKQAITIKPDYYDAIYNLGALYINESNKLKVKANDLPLEDVEGYNALIEQSNEIIRTALPYIEQAYEIDPIEETKAALVGIYTSLKMNDKLEELNK